MLACVSTALLLLPTSALHVTLPGALAVHAAPAAAPAAAAPVDPNSKEGHAAQASDYYARGRFVEASLEFEGLARDYPDEPRFLFNAAASRYAAGHYAHTVKYLSDYLARGEVQGDDRKEAQVQLDEARNKVASVELSVVAPAGVSEGLKLSVRHVARSASDLRPPLEYTARPSAKVPVQLDPGKWVARAEGPGLTPVEQEIEVKAGGRQSAELRLVAAPVTTPREDPPPSAETGVPPALARKLKIGFAAGGGVVAAAGIGVMIAGVVQRSGVATCDGDIGDCKRDLAIALRTRDAGTAVMGAGLGVIAGGLVWISGSAATRKKAWIATSVIGGAAAVGGYVGLLLASKDFNVANTTPLTGTWEQHHGGVGKAGGHAATATILGLGVGLFASSIPGLVIQSRYHNKKPRSAALRSLKIDGAASPWLTGLVVSGRF